MNPDNPNRPAHCSACKCHVMPEEGAHLVRREPDGSLAHYRLCESCLESGCTFGRCPA